MTTRAHWPLFTTEYACNILGDVREQGFIGDTASGVAAKADTGVVYRHNNYSGGSF